MFSRDKSGSPCLSNLSPSNVLLNDFTRHATFSDMMKPLAPVQSQSAAPHNKYQAVLGRKKQNSFENAIFL
jgi:hypothetical protein